eukprot:GAHX01002783.1.p2 GENE.GAHX01002783.1~~GAHX01002783.1.p2  ORF type:complete len:52 (-),score=3.77 GAHX01002783.1:391-546(-)
MVINSHMHLDSRCLSLYAHYHYESSQTDGNIITICGSSSLNTKQAFLLHIL